MRSHFVGLAERALAVADPDPARLVAVIRAALTDRAEARRRIDEGGLAALIATPEQREALQSVGGLMALLEGHGDVVMDRAGAAHVADAERFGSVLRARRASGSPIVRLLRRLIGLEAKLAQYELGERFLARVEEVAGPDAVQRCWERPDNLPSLDEVREPDRWLGRLGLVDAVA
jgi:putative hydrolase